MKEEEYDHYDIELDFYFDVLYSLVEDKVDTDDILQELERTPIGKGKGRVKILKDIDTASEIILR